MRPAMIAGLFLSAAAFQAARADGLIQQLPEDGAQIRYDVDLTMSAGGQEKTTKGSLTVSSVGQATVDNEKCRWIETKVQMEDRDHALIVKMLVPEKDLGKGKSALEHVVRMWGKNGNSEATEVKDFNSPQVHGLRMFFPGAAKKSVELDKIEIDGKLGKLQCAGVSGDYELETGNDTTVSVNFENRLHEKAPFGLVTALWKFEARKNGQAVASGTFKLTLADTSTTALSELPDKN
jgi:hypothetical protein